MYVRMKSLELRNLCIFILAHDLAPNHVQMILIHLWLLLVILLNISIICGCCWYFPEYISSMGGIITACTFWFALAAAYSFDYLPCILHMHI